MVFSFIYRCVRAEGRRDHGTTLDAAAGQPRPAEPSPGTAAHHLAYTPAATGTLGNKIPYRLYTTDSQTN